MRIALLCLLAMTVIAYAQPPGAADATTPPAGEASAERAAPVTHTFGADGRLAFGKLVGWTVAARCELGIAPGHAVVLRAGTGKTTWWESEADDPTYREILARVGYRISSRRVFAGVELGSSWFKGHYPPEAQREDTAWFNDFTLTAVAGVKLGRVRLSLDYAYDFTSPIRQVGAQLGVDIVHL